MSETNENSIFNKKTLFQWITIVFSIIAVVFSFRSDNNAKEANEIARDAKEFARVANELTKEANKLAKEANEIARENHRLSSWANSTERVFAQKVYDLVKELDNTLKNVFNTIIDTSENELEQYDFSKENIFLMDLKNDNNIYNEILSLIGDVDTLRTFDSYMQHMIIKKNRYAKSELMIVQNMRDIIIHHKIINKAKEKAEGKYYLLLSASIDEDTERIEQNSIESENNGELAFSQDTILQFTHYLIKTKHINDPDLLLSYGVKVNNADYVIIALGDGANSDVTDSELMSKYENEYADFYDEYYKQDELEQKTNEDDKGGEKHDVWEFFRNNKIFVITIIAVLLYTVAAIIIIRKKRVPPITEKTDEKEKNTPKEYEVLTPYYGAVRETSNQSTKSIPEYVIIDSIKHKLYSRGTYEKHWYVINNKDDIYKEDLRFYTAIINQDLNDIESIIEQRNPSNHDNPEELSSTFLYADGSLGKKNDQ